MTIKKFNAISFDTWKKLYFDKYNESIGKYNLYIGKNPFVVKHFINGKDVTSPNANYIIELSLNGKHTESLYINKYDYTNDFNCNDMRTWFDNSLIELQIEFEKHLMKTYFE